MNRRTKNIIFALVIVILLAGAAVAAFFGIKRINTPVVEETPASQAPVKEPEPEPEPEPATPAVIDFQPVINSWLSTLSQGTTAGIYIYDLDNDQVVGQHNADLTIPTESLYKLFVVYEGYRRIEEGTIDPNAKVYGSYTWAKCLDLAIRESHSPCAESMHAKMGNNITTLSSTPAKIGAIMKKFYEHPDLSEETWATIKDTMLNQPPVNNGNCSGPCDWRRGLPKGFTSGQAIVYDKVGWYYRSNNIWNSYHDAAIVEFPELGRHYIVVIMTRGSRLQNVVDFGQKIETYILSQD